jgi:hypothetical protein
VEKRLLKILSENLSTKAIPRREVGPHVQGDLRERHALDRDSERREGRQQEEAAPGCERPDQRAQEEVGPVRSVIRGEVGCAMDTRETTRKAPDGPDQEDLRSA